VSKIIIVDGNTGESVTSTDSEQIKLFIDDVHNIKFIPEKDQSKREGFTRLLFIEVKKRHFNLVLLKLKGIITKHNPILNP